jgi:hypothetical protein
MNETNRKKDTRKFYKDVRNSSNLSTTMTLRNLSNLPTTVTVVCKDKNSNIGPIIRKKKKTNSGKMAMIFQRTTNPETERINSIKPHEGPINNLELEEPSYDEINEIIKNMKPNKAAGPDEILLEFIKNGGVILKQKIHQLIVKIWEQEKIPCEWSEGILCPIYKNGDRKQCNNYRGMDIPTEYNIQNFCSIII